MMTKETRKRISSVSAKDCGAVIVIKQCVICRGDFESWHGTKTCSAKCFSARRRQTVDKWRSANLEKSRESTRRRRAADPEKARQASRAYQQKRRATNPEKIKSDKRTWYAKNREKIRNQSREWRVANRERLAEEARQKRVADPEKYRKYSREQFARYASAVKLLKELETNGLGALL